jgi:hypothetical protein
MSKSDSQIIKGIAVLMMLYGHLMSAATSDVSFSLFVGSTPLAIWIKSAMPPVPFFMFISGYGLYLVDNQGGVDKNRFKRVLRIFLALWVTLLIFVPIGSIVKPTEYPGDWRTILGNLTAINPSYNTALWFLVPYVILSVMAPYIFKVFNKFKLRYTFPGIYVVSMTVSWLVPRYQEFLNNNHLLYSFIMCFALLLQFMMGAICAKFGIMQRWKDYCEKHSIIKKLAMPLILLLAIIVCSIWTTPIDFLYCPAIIALVIVAPIPHFVYHFLAYAGKYSMSMWMCHGYFYTLFPGYVYSLKYPLLIYIAFVVCSIITANLIQRISDKIYHCLIKS